MSADVAIEGASFRRRSAVGNGSGTVRGSGGQEQPADKLREVIESPLPD